MALDKPAPDDAGGGLIRFDSLAGCLTGAQKPTVWSLLVTVFGDLAQDEGARISGAVLGRLTDLIGIKPEATRVALHRLRKDGWIDSRRNGRSSDYFLTEWGRAQSAAATPRIYATTPAATEAWLVLTDPATPAGAKETGGAWVASSMLVTATRPDPEDRTLFATRLDAGDAPAWMTAKICDPVLAHLSQDLAARLTALDDALRDTGGLDCLQITALRVLIVHGWRRIALKAPALPDHVFPDAWSGAACRALTAELLQRLPRQALADLEGAAAP